MSAKVFIILIYIIISFYLSKLMFFNLIDKFRKN